VGGGTIKASALEVDGVLYFTMPDNAWAVDARDGTELWHYFWKTKGGTHIGNRGLGMWHKTCSWRRRTIIWSPWMRRPARSAGTSLSPIWRRAISPRRPRWWSATMCWWAPANDIDAPGFVQSFDPETGDVQWKFFTVPMKKGDPGLETWGSVDAARHGGGQAWVPGVYDPETNLYIFSTGNPTPAFTTGTRGPGDNLFTCAIVA
jgi:alcohol dehydrogenase (cytochrome c)